MSQNPYAQFDGNRPGASSSPPSPPQGPVKTSALAIAALVCSLVMCVPGLGLVGLILGLIAFLSIGRSEGRTKGRGLAIIAILIGLIVSAVWIGGVGSMFRMGIRYREQVVEPSFSAFRKLETGDVSGIRELLSPNVSANITDAEILAFRDAYQASSGPFVGESTAFSNVFSAGMAVADPAVQQKFKTTAPDELMAHSVAFTKDQGAIVFRSESVKNPTSFAFGNPVYKGSVVEIAVVVQGKTPILLTDIGTNTAPPADQKPEAPSPGGNGG